MNDKKKYNKDVELVVNLEGEIWRDVIGYEGMYKVSNKGRVASLRKGDFRLLHPNLTNLGYYRVSLKIRPKQTHIFVRRLVAEAFIPNPNGYEFINHKDENGTNNLVENLEWCTTAYNNTYGTVLQRAHETRVRNGVTALVIAYDFDGNPLARYESIYLAAKGEGKKYCAIHQCAQGRTLTSGGKIYLFASDSIEDRLTEIASRPIVSKRVARCKGLT